MEDPDSSDRRRTLRLLAGVPAGFLIAGCLDSPPASRDRNDDSEHEPNESRDGMESNGSGEDDADPDTDGEDTNAETDGDTNADTGSEEGDEGSDGESGAGEDDREETQTDPERWADVDEIVLSATTAGFEGVEPAFIDGVENPTLVLTAGKSYVITWKNADGRPHNIELWDEREAVVDGYETELLEEDGESQSLEFEAKTEMVEYACRLHVDWGKRGDIEILDGY
ncbi:cupredoxin domain-containing protein [Natrononativus amylolyticus]|uniref:cupredoxin domain-containing protein n=1 Tax=Natrononativus amylolyticus TaxID=2963434 RepID=UPI0020CD5702|nr:plastocyanin/azurin family copper-binding protein [Natrononativus amylolyticus]